MWKIHRTQSKTERHQPQVNCTSKLLFDGKGHQQDDFVVHFVFPTVQRTLRLRKSIRKGKPPTKSLECKGLFIDLVVPCFVSTLSKNYNIK